MNLANKLLFCFLLYSFSTVLHAVECSNTQPIHLDDIHLIVSNEAETVSYLKDNFTAREMAHPGDRFDLVRFLSIKWHDPTLTVTRRGPYANLPPERNERWLKSEVVDAQHKPYYGAKWVAIAVPSIEKAREELKRGGLSIFEDIVHLPMEPDALAFKLKIPDGIEIVIVERKNKDFDDYSYSIDHVQFLVSNASETVKFFQNAFSGSLMKSVSGTIDNTSSAALKVADAVLIVSEPNALGIDPKEVNRLESDGTIRLGIDHLGFLYEDIECGVTNAVSNGYTPLFPPTRYKYKNKPTVYSFTAFKSPDGFTIEMVQADGRTGPHSYYDD